MTQKRRSITFAQNTVKQPPAPWKHHKLAQSLVNSENEKENLLSANVGWNSFAARTLAFRFYNVLPACCASCTSYIGARGEKVVEPVQVYLVVKLKLDFSGLGVR